MLDPTTKDMEQLGAIRHYLDNQSIEPEYYQSDTEAMWTGVMIFYMLIAVGLIFTGIGATVGAAILVLGFIVYAILIHFGVLNEM